MEAWWRFGELSSIQVTIIGFVREPSKHRLSETLSIEHLSSPTCHKELNSQSQTIRRVPVHLSWWL